MKCPEHVLFVTTEKFLFGFLSPARPTILYILSMPRVKKREEANFVDRQQLPIKSKVTNRKLDLQTA